jgi:hypothetical protein
MVQSACLRYALDHGQQWGTWGGMTEWKRAPLHRARGQSRAKASKMKPVPTTPGTS